MTDNNKVNNGVVEAPAALNLDTVEREGGNTKVFDFVHNGRRWVLLSPMDLDWQDIISAMTDPLTFFRRTLPPEDVNEFLDTPLPLWKMRLLVDRYMQHYGVPDEGEAGALPR